VDPGTRLDLADCQEMKPDCAVTKQVVSGLRESYVPENLT